MTITRDQAQMIATLACAARPAGARQWKPDAVVAEIAKLRGRSLGAVICAVTRAAMDRNAERPEIIASSGSHWGDTMLASDWVPNSVPSEARCSICSMSEPACRIRWGGDHEFRSAAIAAKEATAASGVPQAVAALKDEIRHTEPRPDAPHGLEDYADRKPELRARVDALRERLPKDQPMREESEQG